MKNNISAIYIQPFSKTTKNNSYFSVNCLVVFKNGTVELYKSGKIKDSICHYMDTIVKILEENHLIDKMSLEEFTANYRVLISRIINVNTINDLLY